jgi:hypothetical protein
VGETTGSFATRYCDLYAPRRGHNSRADSMEGHTHSVTGKKMDQTRWAHKSLSGYARTNSVREYTGESLGSGAPCQLKVA